MFSRVTSSTTTPRKLSGAKKVEAKPKGEGAATIVGAEGAAGGAACCARADIEGARARTAVRESRAFLFMARETSRERIFHPLARARAVAGSEIFRRSSGGMKDEG